MSRPSPILIRPFPEWEGRVSAAFTTRSLPSGANTGSDAAPGPYSDLNLGFRSGDDPVRVAGNWSRVMESTGTSDKTLVLPRMVHGDGLVAVDPVDLDGPGGSVAQVGPVGPDTADAAIDKAEATAGSEIDRLEPEAADAVWTRSRRYMLAVTMADCLTALVFDPESGTIAAIHAGWRGTHARILEKSLGHLSAQGRIRPESTLVAFGPCLRAESLEVGPDVAARLEGPHLIRRAGGFYFDMPGANRSQALASGIAPGNIRDMGGCTLSEPERFFSYRRDGQASGRMAAAISLIDS